MKLDQFFPQLLKTGLRCFDQSRDLRFRFNLALPCVNRSGRAQQIDTGSQLIFDEGRANLARNFLIWEIGKSEKATS